MLEMKKPELKTISENPDKSNMTLKMEPLERGFGITVGNALRRILLGSLPGAAVVGVKISGVEHEFSAIKGIKEEVTEIILNLKSLRFKINIPIEGHIKPFECKLKTNKIGSVTAKDITVPSDIEIANKDQVICTIDEGGKIDMTIYVGIGRGYISADQQERASEDATFIPTDSIFTPVTSCSYEVEKTRVKQDINFDRLTLQVQTDGTVTAKEIIATAAKIMSDHLELIITQVPTLKFNNLMDSSIDQAQIDYSTKYIEEIGLSVRPVNCLKGANINTLQELLNKTHKEMTEIKSLGKKSLEEIEMKLESMGLAFKAE